MTSQSGIEEKYTRIRVIVAYVNRIRVNIFISAVLIRSVSTVNCAEIIS